MTSDCFKHLRGACRGRQIQDLIPGFVDNPAVEIILEAENLLSKTTWLERLSISERTGVGFAAPGGLFTHAMLKNVMQERVRINKDRFAGSTVVELGAGGYHYGYDLAVHLGARGYIGVEPFYSDALEYSLTKRSCELAECGMAIPWGVARYDMLSFLRGVPDESISVFTFGIEDCILGGEQYRRKIESEVFRVLSPAGGYLSSSTDLDVKYLHTEDFKIIRKNSVEKGRFFIK